MVDSAEVSLPGETSSVPAARRFVRDTLRAWGREALVDAACLVVSELATNAVLHARTGLVVRLSTRDAHSLRVEVVDSAAGSPRVRDQATAMTTTGRGLGIVSELSRAWGVEPSDQGKVVWAELRPDGVFPGADGESPGGPGRPSSGRLARGGLALGGPVARVA